MRPLTQTERTHRSRVKRHAKGLCWFCTERVASGSRGMCPKHLAYNARRLRTTQASAKWQPGKPGRPPLWSKQPMVMVSCGDPLSPETQQALLSVAQAARRAMEARTA